MSQSDRKEHSFTLRADRLLVADPVRFFSIALECATEPLDMHHVEQLQEAAIAGDEAEVGRLTLIHTKRLVETALTAAELLEHALDDLP